MGGIDLTICGADELDRHARDFSHVVSIWDATYGHEAGAARIERHFPHAERLVCIFDDVNAPEDGIAPTREAIAAILDFARPAASLLVHCKAGISRSAAVAFSVLCQSRGPGTESEALDEIYRIRPQAMPNKLIVQLADALLSRDGAMIEANEKFLHDRYLNGATDAELVGLIVESVLGGDPATFRAGMASAMKALPKKLP
jgi:predicted protein tyrosine phosphatase